MASRASRKVLDAVSAVAPGADRAELLAAIEGALSGYVVLPRSAEPRPGELSPDAVEAAARAQECDARGRGHAADRSARR